MKDTTTSTQDKSLDPTLIASLKGGIQYRNKGKRLERWKRYARIVSHNYTGGSNVDQPVVNIMAARSRSVAPKLAFNDPTFNVTCVGHMPTPNSEVATAVALEKAWREEEVGSVLQKVLLDWPTFGRGVVFVGFESSAEGDVLPAKQNVAAAQETIDKQSKNRGIIDRARKFLGMGGDTPLDPPSEIRTYRMLLGQRVFAQRVSPFDFVIDPCASSAEDAQFMARRLWLPVARAQMMFGTACPDATGVANAALYSNESEGDPFGTVDEVADLAIYPEEVRRVEAWELWHMGLRKTAYISRDGKALGTYDWKSAHPGFPMVVLDWDEVADCPIPEGLCAAIETLNNELNEVRKRELAELGKAWNKTVGPKDMPLEDQLKLTSAKDSAYVGVEAEYLGQIDVLQNPMLPPDAWTVENRIMANLDELTHQDSTASGGMNPVRRSATEVSASNDASNAVMAFRQMQVERAAEAIAERMAAAIFACFDEPMTVRIVNQDGSGAIVDQLGEVVVAGEQIDFPFVGTEHAGFYKVKVTSGSMASVAGDVERQQYATVWQLLKDEPWFDRESFGVAWLALYPSIKDPSRFVLKGQPAQPAQPEQQIPGMPAPGPGMEPQGQQMQQQPMMPDSATGMGSGNMQADLLAAMGGAATVGTGVNGYPGSVN